MFYSDEMNYENNIKEYLSKEIEVLNEIDALKINASICLIEETRLKGGRVFVFGNGGSAATASHIANDFNKGISFDLKIKHNFICLNDNVATITAIANDDCYENIFINQIENILKPHDIIIAISGSGNSENVIRAVRYAKTNGNKIISMTGYDGGKLKELSDINLHAHVDNMQIAEDVHMIFNHIMMSMLKGCK